MNYEKQNREIHRRNKSKTDINYRRGNCINFMDSIMKVNKNETIFEMKHRLRQEAKELSEKNKNKKVTKYDLK